MGGLRQAESGQQWPLDGLRVPGYTHVTHWSLAATRGTQATRAAHPRGSFVVQPGPECWCQTWEEDRSQEEDKAEGGGMRAEVRLPRT
jgi:hypothetical protein